MQEGSVDLSPFFVGLVPGGEESSSEFIGSFMLTTPPEETVLGYCMLLAANLFVHRISFSLL